jgi:hypothetical protein
MGIIVRAGPSPSEMSYTIDGVVLTSIEGRRIAVLGRTERKGSSYLITGTTSSRMNFSVMIDRRSCRVVPAYGGQSHFPIPPF